LLLLFMQVLWPRRPVSLYYPGILFGELRRTTETLVRVR
jgi:hypothetical protein